MPAQLEAQEQCLPEHVPWPEQSLGQAKKEDEEEEEEGGGWGGVGPEDRRDHYGRPGRTQACHACAVDALGEGRKREHSQARTAAHSSANTSKVTSNLFIVYLCDNLTHSKK